MKTKNLSKKLSLNKATISLLEQPQMAEMEGGLGTARICTNTLQQWPTECGCPYTMTLCGVLQCP